MRATHSSRHADGRKGRPDRPAISPAGRPAAPDPAERARRLADLRAALAGTAPAFDALARRGTGEGRS